MRKPENPGAVYRHGEARGMLAVQIRTNLRKFALVLVGIALDQAGCPLVQAQGPAPQAPPRFEVASIKRNTSGDRESISL